MKNLNVNEIQEVNGGVLPAVLAGIALGSVAKKLYNKYVK
jgi:lactobin A/cerein 7B family class IIb bacteriocin